MRVYSLRVLKKINKRQNNMNRDSGSEPAAPPNGLNFLKQLWNISDKEPLRKAPLPNIPTDIYSVPPTNRRIPQRPHPVR